MALLDKLEQSSLAALASPALTAQDRSRLLGRLTALYATVAANAGTSVALELGTLELQVASRWFG